MNNTTISSTNKVSNQTYTVEFKLTSPNTFKASFARDSQVSELRKTIGVQLYGNCDFEPDTGIYTLTIKKHCTFTGSCGCDRTSHRVEEVAIGNADCLMNFVFNVQGNANSGYTITNIPQKILAMGQWQLQGLKETKSVKYMDPKYETSFVKK